MEKNSHHLIMGEITDFLSGATIADTHDERYHQKLARYLVLTLGYAREKIQQKKEVKIRANGRTAWVIADFLVGDGLRVDMLVKYAPGSLVSRRLSNLALSRIIFPYQIPVVVTTNGEDAEVISGLTGKVLGQGLDAVPGPDDPMICRLPDPPATIPSDLFDKASRIAFACEVDGSCLLNDDFKCSSWYCYPRENSGQD